MSEQTRVSVLSRDGCHLCDDAIEVVRQVCDELQVGWEVIDIDQQPKLLASYSDKVPVTMIDGRQHAYWHVNPQRLREALGATG